MTSLTLDDWRNIATIIGVIVALAALIKGVYEYIKQGTQTRAEQFLELHKQFHENATFTKIVGLLGEESEELKKIALKEKYEYLEFFERIALIVNSGLMGPAIAYYMFGFYVIKCWKSDLFWKVSGEDGVDSMIVKDSDYWVVLRKFVENMQSIQDNFTYREKKLRF